MTGQLARRRIPIGRPRLLAVAAALLALLTALLAGAPSVSAAPGDLSRTDGFCIYNSGSTYTVRSFHNINDGAWVQVRNANNQWTNVNCPADMRGYRVSLKANGTVNPEFTRRVNAMSLSVDKPVVTPGTEVAVTAQLHNWYYWSFGGSGNSIIHINVDANPQWHHPGTRSDQEMYEDWYVFNLRIDYLTTSGALENPPLLAGNRSSSNYPTKVVVPLGTPPGEYTVAMSITSSICGSDNNDARCRARGGPLHPRLLTLSEQVTFTVVEELPAEPASATLTPLATADNPQTGRDETAPATDTAAADGGVIWLQLDALDAEDKLVHPKRLSSNRIVAVGGDLEFWWANADGSRANRASAWRGTSVGSGGHTPMHIAVRKTDRQPGTVEVTATVIGRDGSIAEAEPIVLNFTGPPAKLTLGDDVRVGQPAAGATSEAELALSAADAAGSNVAPGAVAYSVTDADGNAVGGSMISVDTSTAGMSTTTTRDDSNDPVALVTVNPSAEPGAYTITASVPGVDDSSDTAVVNVAGPVASLEVSADPATATTISEVVTLTAMVSDAAGVAVADGTSVTFTLTGGPLVLVGADADGSTAGHQSLTRDGAATAKLVVIGSGTSVIAASSGGQSEVVVVGSTASSMAAAMPEEESEEPRAVDCMRGLIGLTSWNCSEEGSAASVMEELARRGATALYLYDPRSETWTGYAMVNGKVIPGSVNFTISEGDILYVSH